MNQSIFEVIICNRCHRSFSSPEAAIPSVSTNNNDLWPVPNQEVRSSTPQKFETIMIVNGYKNAPLLRLRIFRNWPEVVILGADQRITASGDENAGAMRWKMRTCNLRLVRVKVKQNQSKREIFYTLKRKPLYLLLISKVLSAVIFVNP